MTKKQMRKEKVKEIIKLVKSDVGEDDNFFKRYQNMLADMNLKELEMELELVKKEQN